MDNMSAFVDFLAAPRNGVLRFGLWPASRVRVRGTVLLLGGRTEFMEKYTETIRELNARGFTVCSFDWRGQGFSSRLLADPRKGHIDRFDTYLEDMALIVNTIVAPRAQRPFIILGHSMGGHLGLRFVLEHPALFSKVILASPLIDVRMTPLLKRFVHFLAAVVVEHGGGHAYAIGSGKGSSRPKKFYGNPLTSDRRRFNRTQQMVARQPALAVGGVTYGWLKAAFDSIAALTALADRMVGDASILMLSAGADTIVSNRAQRSMCRVLPACRLQTISGARHEILMEADRYRSLFWEAFDAITLDV